MKNCKIGISDKECDNTHPRECCECSESYYRCDKCCSCDNVCTCMGSGCFFFLGQPLLLVGLPFYALCIYIGRESCDCDCCFNLDKDKGICEALCDEFFCSLYQLYGCCEICNWCAARKEYASRLNRPHLKQDLINMAIKDYRKNRENGLEIDNPIDFDFELRLMSKSSSGIGEKKIYISQREKFLVSDSNGIIQTGSVGERKIYISQEGEFLLRDSNGMIQKDNFGSIDIDLSDLPKKIKKIEFKKAVLKITAEKGYTPYRPFPEPDNANCKIVFDLIDHKIWWIEYTEGGKIKEWMEEKDANYLARLEKEGISIEYESRSLQPPVINTYMSMPPPLPSSPSPSFPVAMDEMEIVIEDEDPPVRYGVVPSYGISKPESEMSSSSAVSQDVIFNQLHLSIPYETIKLERKLGEGGFGVVSYGHWHCEEVAVKQLHLQQMTEKTLASFKEEAMMMARLHSDYIVSFKGVTLSPYSLVMQYMPGGSLFSVLHSNAMLSWSTRHSIALDIAKGLVFLHSQSPMIVHRDLKSLNVLLTGHQQAKLADFGLAQVRAEASCSVYSHSKGNQKSVGTLPWMAPECFGLKPKYSDKSDMYAYGMVLWEIVSRKIPYDGVSADEIRSAVKEGEREEVASQMTQLELDRQTAKTPQSIKGFIRLCWFQEASQRPTAKRAVEAFELHIEKVLAPENPGLGELDSGFQDNLNSVSFKY